MTGVAFASLLFVLMLGGVMFFALRGAVENLNYWDQRLREAQARLDAANYQGGAR